MTIHFTIDAPFAKKVLWTESFSPYNYPARSRLLIIFLYCSVAGILARTVLFPTLAVLLPRSAAAALSLLCAALLCGLYRWLVLSHRFNKRLQHLIFQPGQKQSLTLLEDSFLHCFGNGKFSTKHPYSAITALFRRKEWIVIYMGRNFIYFPLEVFRTSEEFQYFWDWIDQKRAENAGRLDVSKELQNYKNASFQFHFTWTQQELANALMDVQELSNRKPPLIAALQRRSIYVALLLLFAVYAVMLIGFPNANRLLLYIPAVIVCYLYLRILPPRPRYSREQLNTQIQKIYAPAGYLDPQCVAIDGSCIVLALTGLLCSYPLSQLQKIDASGCVVSLSFGIYGSILVPMKAFESPEQKQAFLKALEGYGPIR